MICRRQFLGTALGATAIVGTGGCASRRASETKPRESPFLTRGAVLVVRDMATLDWPALAHEADLTTLATHIRPSEIADFVATDVGWSFLAGCSRHGLEVEHELHALDDLLPRTLFDRDPTMFRLDSHVLALREVDPEIDVEGGAHHALRDGGGHSNYDEPDLLRLERRHKPTERT